MQQACSIYTVSQVNSLIKAAIETQLPASLVVRGEISGWTIHSSGHCYFSLKDESGILPCVMWASSFRRVKYTPEDGMAILATGYIDVFLKGGKYQFYVDKMELAGFGALQLAFEQMVKKLQIEGLFKEKSKKSLPTYPERIGIITSETGAAIHDIKESIHSRWPCVKLFLYPVPVQGEGAAEKIARALYDINKRNNTLKLDLLIVGRGGGSIEDLWAFNEEVLARAIFASKISIISAVGHEVDTTIADLVADARASTPTKAGIVAVPDVQEVLGQLVYFQKRLDSMLRAKMGLCRENLHTVLASSVFRNPLLLVYNAQQLLDESAVSMAMVIRQLLAKARQRLSESYENVAKIEPHRLLGSKKIDLNNLQNRSNAAISTIIHRLQIQLTAAANRLEGLNPKTILRRGYSITKCKKTGLLIGKSGDIQIGDYLITELSEENLIESKVTKK